LVNWQSRDLRVLLSGRRSVRTGEGAESAPHGDGPAGGRRRLPVRGSSRRRRGGPGGGRAMVPALGKQSGTVADDAESGSATNVFDPAAEPGSEKSRRAAYGFRRL